MSQINMASILKKAEEYMETPEMQKKVEEKIDSIVLGEISFYFGGHNTNKVLGQTIDIKLAADKFIEVLINEIIAMAATDSSSIASGGLGPTAIEALTKLVKGRPYKIGKNRYKIEISFSEDLSRESLSPEDYEGVQNIAALLNKGYNASHSVYGVWKGHGDNPRFSLKHREGSHFIENAIQNFMGNYAYEFGVISVTPNDIYV